MITNAREPEEGGQQATLFVSDATPGLGQVVVHYSGSMGAGYPFVGTHDPAPLGHGTLLTARAYGAEVSIDGGVEAGGDQGVPHAPDGCVAPGHLAGHRISGGGLLRALADAVSWSGGAEARAHVARLAGPAGMPDWGNDPAQRSPYVARLSLPCPPGGDPRCAPDAFDYVSASAFGEPPDTYLDGTADALFLGASGGPGSSTGLEDLPVFVGACSTPEYVVRAWLVAGRAVTPVAGERIDARLPEVWPYPGPAGLLGSLARYGHAGNNTLFTGEADRQGSWAGGYPGPEAIQRGPQGASSVPSFCNLGPISGRLSLTHWSLKYAAIEWEGTAFPVAEGSGHERAYCDAIARRAACGGALATGAHDVPWPGDERLSQKGPAVQANSRAPGAAPHHAAKVVSLFPGGIPGAASDASENRFQIGEDGDQPAGQRTLGTREQAIICLAAAIDVLSPEDTPAEWAMLQRSLGLAYLEREGADRSSSIEGAITCFKAALTVFVRHDDPRDWASTQADLATAYRVRLTGDRAANLELALQCLEASTAPSGDGGEPPCGVFDKQAAWDAL